MTDPTPDPEPTDTPYVPLVVHSSIQYPAYINDGAAGTLALQALGFDTSYTQPGWAVIWDPRMGAISVMGPEDFAANWTIDPDNPEVYSLLVNPPAQ
jgi:hypothetical protein